jgi:hypothetical protein
VEAYHQGEGEEKTQGNQGEDSHQVEGTAVGKAVLLVVLVVGRAVLLLAGEGILGGMGIREVVD